MPVIKPLTFWPWQAEVWACGPQVCGTLAGVGAGKTMIHCLKLLWLLDQYPGSRGVIIRQRATQLRKTILPVIMKLLPQEQIARRNFNEGSLTLKNGSELLFMHLDGGEESLANLKSLEINFFYIDQAEDIAEVAFDTLMERIGRWSGATKRGGWPEGWMFKNRLGENIPPPYPMLSFYSPGFDSWLAKRFWEHGTEREKYRQRGYICFRGSTRDNLALSQEYVEGRLAMGSEYVKRFVDATEWGAREGRVFSIHPDSILDPTPDLLSRIKHTMRLHRSYDHGEAHESVCMWYGSDTDHNLIFYREYAAVALVSDLRAAIYELSRPDFGSGAPISYYSNYADPSIRNKTRGRTPNSAPTWSVWDEFVDARIMDPKTAIAWRLAPNDESMTISRVREYLRFDKTHRNPFTGRMGSPRVFFVRRTPEYLNGCHEVLVDIRAQRWKEVGEMADGTKLYGDKRDDRVRDDWYDSAKYAISSRPALGLRATAPPPEPGTIRINEYQKLIEAENARAKMEFQKTFRGKPIGY